MGEYITSDRLGRGGMGVVYRAVHRGSGEQVALKTVHAPSEHAFACLRREIQALARARHPNVVRVLDQGVEGGLPWYAMELIEGRTLLSHVFDAAAESRFPRAQSGGETDSSSEHDSWGAETITDEDASLLAESGKLDIPADSSPHRATRGDPSLANTQFAGEAPSSQPEPAQLLHPAAPAAAARYSVPPADLFHATLPLLNELCSALAFLHGEGIVHRDLKPDNIIVRADHTPVLVDFGIASEFSGSHGRDSLGYAAGAMGTAAYIAPEQVRGELVDARADLYSLGCILYELITGQPPFVAASVGHVLHAQLYELPAPPNARAPWIPDGLNELVLKLLAKNPARRIGYAVDVRRALRALVGGAATASVGPGSTPYLYQPELGGRDVELARLGESVRRALAGEGGLAWLSGESGIGKTRLLLQLIRSAARGDVRVVTCGADPPRGELSAESFSTMRALLAALADYCQSVATPEADALLGGARGSLGVYEPRLAAPGPAPRRSPTELEAEAVSQLTAVISRWSACQPLLLLLDDLQWADELSLRFLASIREAGAFARCAVLVIGCFRSDEASPELRALAAPGSTPGQEHIELAGLDPASVCEIAASMLALPEPPPELSAFLIERAAGNPFFVSEYLRTAVSEGLLTRDLDGNWQLGAAAGLTDLPLPSNLAELVKLRLRHLTPAANYCAEISAVFGRQVSSSMLFQACLEAARRGFIPELCERDYDIAIKLLLVQHVLEQPLPPLGSEGSEPSPDLEFAHDKLHEVVYARLDPARRQELHEIAAECLQGVPTPGPTHLLRVAQHFEAAHKYAGAVDYLLRASRAFEARSALPDALSCAERGAELGAAHLVGEALGLEAMLQLGELETATGDIGSARQRLRQVAQDAASSGDARRQVRAHTSLSYLAYLRAEGEQTREHAERAAELVKQLNEPALEARVENALGIAWGSTGHYRIAIGHYTRAAQLCEAAGDTTATGRHQGNISINQRLLGELDAALANAQRALELAEGASDVRMQANALCNRGRVELEQGQLARARHSFATAVELATRVEMAFVVAEAAWGLGVVELRAGNLAEAERRAQQASRMSERGYSVTLALAERLFGQIEAARGDLRAARAHLTRSVEILRPAGERDELADSLMALADLEHPAAESLRAEAVAIYRDLDMQGRLREPRW